MFTLVQEFNFAVDTLVAGGSEPATTNWLFLSITAMIIVCVLTYRYRSVLHKIWDDG